MQPLHKLWLAQWGGFGRINANLQQLKADAATFQGKYANGAQATEAREDVAEGNERQRNQMLRQRSKVTLHGRLHANHLLIPLLVQQQKSHGKEVKPKAMQLIRALGQEEDTEGGVIVIKVRIKRSKGDAAGTVPTVLSA